MGLRQLKKEILELLSHKDFEKKLEKIIQLPARRAVNPLFSFLYNGDELIKWRAVTAMGAIVSNLADHYMESGISMMRLWFACGQRGNFKKDNSNIVVTSGSIS